MTWAAIGGAAVGVIGNAVIGGGGSGGSTGSGQTPYYIPKGLSSADTGWQNAFGGTSSLASQGAAAANPLYQQTLAQQEAINYAPYTQAAQQAGGQYGWRFIPA